MNFTYELRDGKIKKGDYMGCEILITEYAITIKKDRTIFQIITKFVGSPTEVVGQFDFKHNMFYHWKGSIYCLSGLSYLYSENLWFNFERARDIANVLIRVAKFTQRGFKIRQFEHKKIILKLLSLSPSELEREKQMFSSDTIGTY